MSERLTHSKPAVASTILPLAIWLYLALIIGAYFASDKLGISFFGGYEGAWALGLLFYFVLLIVIPICGHLAGIVCGIIGLFSKNKKRIFAVIGLILNITPFVVGFILYKSGYSFGSK